MIVVIALLACVPSKSTDSADTGASTAYDTARDAETGTLSYAAHCLHEVPDPIIDAFGTFTITGVDGVPEPMPVGTALDSVGGLTVYACSPNWLEASPILDDLVFSVALSLFDHDDAPLDMGVANDADSVNAVTGTATDWHDIVDWDEDETFMHFRGGSSSFSEIDKDGGRLVGTVDVTETDPPGYEMQIDIDLTWAP